MLRNCQAQSGRYIVSKILIFASKFTFIIGRKYCFPENDGLTSFFSVTYLPHAQVWGQERYSRKRVAGPVHSVSSYTHSFSMKHKSFLHSSLPVCCGISKRDSSGDLIKVIFITAIRDILQ